MPRNRVIYQSEALFAAPTGTLCLTTGEHNLRRIQSCNYNFAIQRQDINQYGELAAIDRLIIQEPTVSVDMSYYFEPSGFNEQHMGLQVNTTTTEVVATGASTISDHMLNRIIASGAQYDQKNIFVLISDAGIDANDTAGEGPGPGPGMGVSGNYNGIIGIGNAFLTSWSLDASVGAIPTVSCAFEGQNINFTGWGSDGITSPNDGLPLNSGSIFNPSIFNGAESVNANISGMYVSLPSGAGLFQSESQVSAVRPGDVTVLLTAYGTDNAPVVGFLESDLKVQSVNFGLTVGREPIRKLGSMFAFTREITFPINCTMSVSAIVGDTVGKRLFSLVTGNGDIKYNCAVKLTGYRAGSATGTDAYLVLKGAKIDSQNVTSSIGPNKAITIELSAQIGRNSGLHMYGKSATP
jgi:hypothetical protein